MMTASSKQRRTAAIAKRFPSWSLTDGKTSHALHIGASFRCLDDLASIRKRWPFMPTASRQWHMAVAVPDAVRSSRFNMSLCRNRLP